MSEILTSLVTVLINYSLQILEWWNESDIDKRLIHINTKTFPENPVGKWIENDFLGHSSGKFPGAREYLEKQSCFSGRKFVFYWKSHIWYHAGFRFSQPFSLKWNWFVQMVNAIMAGKKFTFSEICLLFLNRELTGLPLETWRSNCIRSI